MKLQQFVRENSIREFEYFELGKSNPTELEILSGLEISYFKNGYKIYKSYEMNHDYEIFTYIFDNNDLY